MGARSDERLLPARIDRALIVSPFLKRALLDEVDVAWDRLSVVSRSAELDSELTEDLSCEALELKPDLVGDDVDEFGDGMTFPLSGLHAKVFVFDTGRDSTTWVGSANATCAAFNTNVEILLELEGSRSGTGVAKWLEDAASAEQQTFRSILQEHVWSDVPVVTDDEADTDLDRARREFAAIPVDAWVEHLDDMSFSVRYMTCDPLPDLPGIRIRARPLTLSGWHGVPTGSSLDLTRPATLEGLTGFLVYELRRGRLHTEFVVRAEMHGEPDGRRGRLIAQLLQDPDRLIRYLMLLLRDEIDDRFNNGDGGGPPPGGGGASTLETLPLVERFVRAASRKPETIGHIQQLFADLENTGVVPPGLRELWAEIWDAVSDGSVS
jgi:hypothetical protein